MKLIYGITQQFHDRVRSLPQVTQTAIEKAVNKLGTTVLADINAACPGVYQPTRLILRHGYTPTLCVMSVSAELDVVLCYDRDEIQGRVTVSLLDVTTPVESHTRFLMAAKSLYGPLFLGTANP
jgi:hypothetical protein